MDTSTPDTLELVNFILTNFEECGDGFMISNSDFDQHMCIEAMLYRKAKAIRDFIDA